MVDYSTTLEHCLFVYYWTFFAFILTFIFREEGENRAVKEDTGEITSIDESVRSNIAEIATARGIYIREQKECLLKYYDLLIEFYYEKLIVNFGDFPINHGESLAVFPKIIP